MRRTSKELRGRVLRLGLLTALIVGAVWTASWLRLLPGADDRSTGDIDALIWIAAMAGVAVLVFRGGASGG